MWRSPNWSISHESTGCNNPISIFLVYVNTITWCCSIWSPASHTACLCLSAYNSACRCSIWFCFLHCLVSCSIHEPNQDHSSQQRGCSALPHQHLPDIHQDRSTPAHSGVFPAGLHSCHAAHHDADWHAHPGSCVSLWCALAGEHSNHFSLRRAIMCCTAVMCPRLPP